MNRNIFSMVKNLVLYNMKEETITLRLQKYNIMLTSYLGLWDEQLSPPGGRGSCEERKEEKEGWQLFRGISLRQVARVNSKIKYIFILFLPGPYLS